MSHHQQDCFRLQERTALLKIYIWYNERKSMKLRKKGISLERKITQTRELLSGRIQYLQEQLESVKIHFNNLTQTEITLRNQLLTMYEANTQRVLCLCFLSFFFFCLFHFSIVSYSQKIKNKKNTQRWTKIRAQITKNYNGKLHKH